MFRPALCAVLLLGTSSARAEDKTPPVSHEHMQQDEATSVLGRDVKGPSGDTLGKIVNVLVDESGQPRAAVIDFGGFMGVGSRKIAVAWRALHFSTAPGGKPQITLDMTADQIKATPEFTATDKPVTVAAPPRPGTPNPEPAGPH
jgi:PRC-barrel domain